MGQIILQVLSHCLPYIMKTPETRWKYEKKVKLLNMELLSLHILACLLLHHLPCKVIPQKKSISTFSCGNIMMGQGQEDPLSELRLLGKEFLLEISKRFFFFFS